MIPKTYSKIFTISIFFLLATSAVIPIAHASEENEFKRAFTLPNTSNNKTSGPIRRAASAPVYSDRSELLKNEPIPAPFLMVESKVKRGTLSEKIIPSAGFIPESSHQSSQFDTSNIQAAKQRLKIDAMRGNIIPAIEELLTHTWPKQPAPTVDIKNDLLEVIKELRANNPQEASLLSASLIEKVNDAEKEGPLDEFSRLGLYSVQTVLHLLAGTPYTALNNFLELRQLGISWHSRSPLIAKLFKDEGKFYEDMTRFVSSDKATTIWGEDERIGKLWQGHSQFAWDQSYYEDISRCLGDLGDAAGAEGELTFRHTMYVLGKMQLRFGEHLKDATAESLLAAAERTLEKISDYRFEGLFSYRNVATKAFLGDGAWARYKLTGQAGHLGKSLTYYINAIPLIEPANTTGADMIKSSFNHAKNVVEAYGDLPAESASNSDKIVKLALLRETLIKLQSDSLPHIDIPTLRKNLDSELTKLMQRDASGGTKSKKKRKGDDFGEESQVYDFGNDNQDQQSEKSAKKKKEK